jgi:hypothetical protein
VIWSVDRKKIVNEGDWLETPDGLLDETLFMVTSLSEVQSACSPEQVDWVVDNMSCGSYSDVENVMDALYEIAQKQLSTDSEKHRILEISFMTLWTVSGSTDYETGIWELDSIDLVGEGQVILKEG